MSPPNPKSKSNESTSTPTKPSPQFTEILPPSPFTTATNRPTHLHRGHAKQSIVYGASQCVIIRKCRLPTAVPANAKNLLSKEKEEDEMMQMICCKLINPESEKDSSKMTKANYLTTTAESPDGMIIATADANGQLYILTKNVKGMTYSKMVLDIGFRCALCTDIQFTEDAKIVAVSGLDPYGDEFVKVVRIPSKDVPPVSPQSSPTASKEIDSTPQMESLCGHKKGVNAIGIRNQQPYRIVTAGDDGLVNMYEVPTFKLCASNGSPKGAAVYCCRYSPFGNLLATCDAHGQLAFYHPTRGYRDREFQISEKSLLSLSWSEDTDIVAAVGVDGLLQLFNCDSDTVVATRDVAEEQSQKLPVGVSWISSNIICVLTMCGHILGYSINLDDEKSKKSKIHLQFEWIGLQGPCVNVASVSSELTFCCSGRGSVALIHSGAENKMNPKQGAVNKETVASISNAVPPSITSAIYLPYLPDSDDPSALAPASSVSDCLISDISGIVVFNKKKSIARISFHALSTGDDKSKAKDHRKNHPLPWLNCKVTANYAFDQSKGNISISNIVNLRNQKYVGVITKDNKIQVFPWNAKASSFGPLYESKVQDAESMGCAVTNEEGSYLALNFSKLQDGINDKICVYHFPEDENLKSIKPKNKPLEVHNKNQVICMSISKESSYLASADSASLIFVTDLTTMASVVKIDWSKHSPSKICSMDWSVSKHLLAVACIDGSLRLANIDKANEITDLKSTLFEKDSTDNITIMRFINDSWISSCRLEDCAWTIAKSMIKSDK